MSTNILTPGAAPEEIDSGVQEPALSRLHRAGIRGRLLPAVAAVVLVVLLGWVFFPELFTDQNPSIGVPADKFHPPSAAHLFGTDYLGRDVFSRVVHGASASWLSALLAVGIALAVGSALGILAGLSGHRIDSVVGRLADLLLAVPGFLLAIIIVVSLGFSTLNAAVAVGIASIPAFIRQTRSEVLRVRSLGFVEASYLVGGNRSKTVVRHIIPNIYRGVLALVVINFGYSLITIAGLAFLGFADPPPASDWGIILGDGRQYLSKAPWAVYFPGLAIIVSVLIFNQLSRVIAGRRA